MVIQNETKYWLVRPGVDAKCFDDFYRDKSLVSMIDKKRTLLLEFTFGNGRSLCK